jgi:RNA polymerase sigma factor (sigma-70 family)
VVTLHAAIEQMSARLWAICYRMTGRSADADDLCQEAIARAIERSDQLRADDPAGWLVRIATTTCLDHLRRTSVQRRVNDLIDFVELPGLSPGELAGDPQHAAILREDIRYAFVVALQRVPPRQWAALILHDVCDRPLGDVAALLEINDNAAKQLVHRARTAVKDARRRDDVDVPVDVALVEALARAVESGSLDTLAALLADDAWGLVDGGDAVPVASEPSLGRDAVMRRFANGWRRLDNVPLTAEIRVLNGEPAVVVRLGASVVVAMIQVETHHQRIVSLRVDRDPNRTRRLVPTVLGA